MGRWEPDARGRLEQAAMQLYRERGFEATTVAEIAERAGLTERTFFRHFADKREVLFAGASTLQELLVTGVRQAPAAGGPIEAITGALTGVAAVVFEERRDFVRQRQAIIATNADLQERELIKLARLAAALGEALRARGVGEPAASLAGEAGIAILKVAFERWLADPAGHDLAYFIREAAAELAALTA